MYSWNVREVSPTEYHVVETRYVNEPEFILARCGGPIPAHNIVNAMRIAQSIRDGIDGIHNSLFGIQSALQRFKEEVAK